MKVETINNNLYIYHEENADTIDPFRIYAYEVSFGTDIHGGRYYYTVTLLVNPTPGQRLRYEYQFEKAQEAREAKALIYDHLLPFILKS